MKLLLFCLLAMLWSVGQTHAQTSEAKIRPLFIGDTIPSDLEITNVYNYPTSKIRLADLKGKLVILDFWERGCSSCMVALNKLQQLTDTLSGKIEVLTITKLSTYEQISSTLKKVKVTSNVSLPVIVHDSVLSRLFPYEIISHLVWIDPHQVVRGITGSEYISTTNALKIFGGEKVNWPQKKDAISFDYKEPVYKLNTSSEAQNISPFYSSLSGHINGIENLDIKHIDSTAETITINRFNKSLLELCTTPITGTHHGLIYHKKLILNVRDKSRFIHDPKTSYYTDWAAKNTFTYSTQIPFTEDGQSIKTYLREDMTRWLRQVFNISVEYRNEEIECLLLRKIVGGNPIKSKKRKTVSGINKKFKISDLLWVINREDMYLPWTVNETDLPDSTLLNFSISKDSFQTLSDLQGILKQYGYDLIPAKRSFLVHIVTEHPTFPYNALNK